MQTKLSFVQFTGNPNLPLRALFHKVKSVSPVSVPPRVHNGAAGGEGDLIESHPSCAPQTCPCEVVVYLQLASVLVVGQLTADLTVRLTGGVL